MTSPELSSSDDRNGQDGNALVQILWPLASGVKGCLAMYAPGEERGIAHYEVICPDVTRGVKKRARVCG